MGFMAAIVRVQLYDSNLQYVCLSIIAHHGDVVDVVGFVFYSSLSLFEGAAGLAIDLVI